MYTIKCKLCDAIIAQSTVEDNNSLCGNHTIEEVNEFINPTTWDTIREQRNQLLIESDWTQLLDAPLTPEEQAEWAKYRQSLRDIPETTELAKEVLIPETPIMTKVILNKRLVNDL